MSGKFWNIDLLQYQPRNEYCDHLSNVYPIAGCTRIVYKIIRISHVIGDEIEDQKKLFSCAKEIEQDIEGRYAGAGSPCKYQEELGQEW